MPKKNPAKLSAKIPVKIKTFAPTPLPTYHTAGAVGFDLSSAVDTTIATHTVALIPTGIAVAIPPNYWLLLAARSSLHRLGLMLPNGVGVIDPDYCGDDDQINLLLFNFTTAPVTVTRGMRLAQGILVPRLLADFQPVTKLTAQNRGGFGSTGL